jgi:hypothetical protein
MNFCGMKAVIVLKFALRAQWAPQHCLCDHYWLRDDCNCQREVHCADGILAGFSGASDTVKSTALSEPQNAPVKADCGDDKVQSLTLSPKLGGLKFGLQTSLVGAARREQLLLNWIAEELPRPLSLFPKFRLTLWTEKLF